MSNKLYYDNVCNRCLDLSNLQLSPSDWINILWCLNHQELLPPAIRVNIVDLRRTNITNIPNLKGILFV